MADLLTGGGGVVLPPPVSVLVQFTEPGCSCRPVFVCDLVEDEPSRRCWRGPSQSYPQGRGEVSTTSSSPP